MGDRSDKKHYIETVGANFASGFLYGAKVAQIEPTKIVPCLDREDEADRIFYSADMMLTQGFHMKDQDSITTAIEKMMDFVVIMLRENYTGTDEVDHQMCDLGLKPTQFIHLAMVAKEMF